MAVRLGVVPRYRFHLYNNTETIDHEGRDFANFEAAQLEAIADARELMCADMKANGEINLNHWIELEDDEGGMVIVSFRDAVSITL